MKKRNRWFTGLLIGNMLLFLTINVAFGQRSKSPSALNIVKLELGYPHPAIPFYHFKADIELPQEYIIEVEAALDGNVLRSVDLRGPLEIDDPQRLPVSSRSPSGTSVSLDGTHYKNLSVIGWVKWEPAKEYIISITVRAKENIQPSVNDVILSATRKVVAPEVVNVFDPAWSRYKSIVLSETGGITRTGEPVEVMLAFYPDEAEQLTRDIRVVAVNPSTYELAEVPSQVYDVQEYLVKDDQAPDSNGNPTREVPLWMPTVTARVAFLADIAAKTSRVYLVYYDNPAAITKNYVTDLRVLGEAPGLRIDNDLISIVLHPNSGHLDEITLKSRPGFPLYHRLETNGAMHWNPDIYVPPRAWTHTADWKPPRNVKTVAGPIIARTDFWDNLREVPEVDASVRYEFYPDAPYFISSTSMRINETVHSLALRNAEMVFKRELITHAAWYDVIREKVVVYDVLGMPDLTDLKMEADIPWILFYNEEHGVGFAGIQLDYSNSGIENPARLLNPYFYITAGPWVYWARALSHPYLSSNMQQVVPVLKGNVFNEKWAYLMVETDKGPEPWSQVEHWLKRLTQPVRVQLVEEVDERVSRTLQEVFMDEGKSGWEGRSTHKHVHE